MPRPTQTLRIFVGAFDRPGGVKQLCFLTDRPLAGIKRGEELCINLSTLEIKGTVLEMLTQLVLEKKELGVTTLIANNFLPTNPNDWSRFELDVFVSPRGDHWGVIHTLKKYLQTWVNL